MEFVLKSSTQYRLNRYTLTRSRQPKYHTKKVVNLIKTEMAVVTLEGLLCESGEKMVENNEDIECDNIEY